MQRLFASFPNGWPGTGLLLLRIAVAATVIPSGITSVFPFAGNALSLVLNVIVIGAGALLLVGLWTPLAGITLAFGEVWYFYSAPERSFVHLLAAVLAAALAMLGPGAQSIDAKLFGRKRVRFDRT